MKKIILTISFALAVFVSLGFIVLNDQATSQVQFEQVSGEEVKSESRLIQETNDEQW